MKSIRIYQAGTFQVGSSIELDRSASHHLIKVLRLKNNYTFNLFNGEGMEFSAILEVSGKRAVAHIQSSADHSHIESDLNIHLLQGISKGERMDFAIQKSVELGVTSITPVNTERTVVNLNDERQQKKRQHWQAIAISACEQSGRSVLPKINPICDFSQIIKSDTNSLRLLLDPLSESNIHKVASSKDIEILIGPEGGLSEREIKLAKEHGFIGIKMGPRILRTETAALAAITSVQLLWGDLAN